MQSAGVIGAGSSIRLRGNTSVALSNQPLVYVDGVRVRSDEYPKNVPAAGGQNLRSSHVNASPIDDINPDDIERVEVLKGAAASTLYGTEAAAGVIQIFTKRGAAGNAQWTAQVNQGVAKERHLRKDPRVAMTVVDPENTYQWVSVSGRAELTTDGADEQIDKLAKKYLGQDKYPWRSAEEQRISVKITPEQVDSAGFDD